MGTPTPCSEARSTNALDRRAPSAVTYQISAAPDSILAARVFCQWARPRSAGAAAARRF